jgi:hypothetical protein
VALWLTRLTLAQLYLVAGVEGTLFVFFNLAEVASLPRVVTTEQLPAATTQNQATDGVTALLSPQLGGALYGALRALPFEADAVSYGASAISPLFIRARFQAKRTLARRRLHVEILEGLTWLWRQPCQPPDAAM